MEERLLKLEQLEASKSVQAFINNISFPVSLDELKVFIYEHGCFNVEDILENQDEVWTVPRWTKAGDISFFMHSKTAKSKITAVRTELNKNRNQYSTEEYDLIVSWINRALTLYEKYGGKIFAIGRVSGKPKNEFYQDDDEVPFHWKSTLYADIDSVYVLKNPVDISEFNDFILVTRGGAITGVFGEQYEKLRDIIGSKNWLPKYVRESASIPIPLNKINKENWISLAGEFRRSFFLETQFRSFYTDYLLSQLGDQKKIYRECRCTKSTNPDSFVDNIIKLNRKYLPVEIKLNIQAEKNVKGQVIKYCHVDRCFLTNKEDKYIDSRSMYSSKVVVIDTFGIYIYDADTDSITKLYDFDNLRSDEDIKIIRNKILAVI